VILSKVIFKTYCGNAICNLVYLWVESVHDGITVGNFVTVVQ